MSKKKDKEVMTPEELIQYLKKSSAPIKRKIRNIFAIRGQAPIYVLMRIAKLAELQEELELNDEIFLGKIDNYLKTRLSYIISDKQYDAGELRFESSQYLYNLDFADFVETIKKMKKMKKMKMKTPNGIESFDSLDKWEDFLKQSTESAEDKVNRICMSRRLVSTYLLIRILFIEEIQEEFGIKDEKMLGKIKNTLLSRLGIYMKKSDRKQKILRFGDFPNIHELDFPKFVEALNVLKEKRKKKLKGKYSNKSRLEKHKTKSEERDIIYNLTRPIECGSRLKFEYGLTDT